MKTKEEQIQAKLAKPFEIGDKVAISIPYTTVETSTEGRGKAKKEIKTSIENVFKTEGTIEKINEKTLVIISSSSVKIPFEIGSKMKYDYRDYNKIITISKEYVTQTASECGANPFKKEAFRVDFFNQDIYSILLKACYSKRDNDFSKPDYEDRKHGGINFNPFVIDNTGKRVHYQRDFVWNLEQKQLLIDSIYNGIEIGKFLFRYRSWPDIQQQITENGHGYNFDCVDGKQRFGAIIEFLQNKYPDSYGNYWDDLSTIAQRRFLNYNKLSYGQMGENAMDEDVVETFLTLNFTGTPMSKEHIDFVKSIKL